MQSELLIRMVVAALLAAPLGWNRERSARPAGLRTHVIVAITSALFVGLGDTYLATRVSEHVQMDPARVLQAVAAGVSFLGAGTVFVSRNHNVQGLTTAATLWAVSAIGVAAGLAQYLLAGGASVLCAVVLVGARQLERRAETKAAERAESQHALKRGSRPPTAASMS